LPRTKLTITNPRFDIESQVRERLCLINYILKILLL